MESASVLSDEQVGFPKQCLFQEALASPPWGRQERGLELHP